MAKATAHCTCKICGAEFTRENTLRNRTEADRWQSWAESNFDLCPSCYGRQQREAEKAKGLYVNVRLDHHAALMSGKVSLALIFEGDTYPYKDEIKALGAKWTDTYPGDGFLGDLLRVRRPPTRWALTVSIDDYADTVSKVEGIGGRIEETPTAMDLAMLRAEIEAHRDSEAKKSAERETALAELGAIPAWPERIKTIWPEGAKWNRKVYGKKGAYRIYLANQEIKITDEEKSELETTAEAREAWRTTKKQIMSR